MRRKSQSTLPPMLLLCYVAILLIIVWTPVANDSGALLGIFRINGWLERALNVFLFLPYPVLILNAYWDIRISHVLTIGPLTSVVIELGQNFISGRVSDINDFILNSGGYFLSLGITLLVQSKNLKRRNQAVENC